SDPRKHSRKTSLLLKEREENPSQNRMGRHPSAQRIGQRTAPALGHSHLQPDARIDHCTDDINYQADYNDDRGIEHDNPLNHGHVLRSHRVEQEDADSFDRKRLFGEDGTREENGKLKTEHGHDRYQRVLERVPVDNGPSRYSTSARGFRKVR